MNDTKVITDQKTIKYDSISQLNREIYDKLVQIDDVEIMELVVSKLTDIRDELRAITDECDTIRERHFKNLENEHKETMKRIKKEKGLKP